MRNVKLISNLEDNNHCFQACFAMVLRTLKNPSFSMADSDRLTGFVEGRPTWPYKGMLELADEGLYVRYIEQFSQIAFVENPTETIKKHVKNENIAQAVINVSDFTKETELVKQCLSHPRILFEERKPDLQDIQEYLGLNSLLITNVNYFALIKEEGYNGHFVVIDEIINGNLRLQNPGLPPIADQIVPLDLFLEAWYSPNENLANLIVVSPTELTT